MSRPRALQQAQYRLRNLSDRDLQAADEEVKQALDLKKKARNTPKYEQSLQEYLFRLNIWQLIDKVFKEKRYHGLSHPFYWAAFTCQGLA